MISVKANTATSLPQFGHWRQLTDISIEEKGVTEGISFIAGLQDSFCEIQSATPCSLCTYPICKGSTFPPFKTLFLGSEQYWSHSKSRSEQAEFTVKQKSQLIYIYYPRVASVFKDMENVFTEETCKSCLQKDPQLIPNSVLHLSEYQGEKKKLKNLSAASLSSSTRSLFPSLCICSKIPSTFTFTTYLSTLAPVCLSSHRKRSHSRPAVKGSIESSPRSPPCQHVDSTTQRNSKTNLTFSPTSRNIRYERVKLFQARSTAVTFWRTTRTRSLPRCCHFPCCLQPSTQDSLRGRAIHHCCEWSSPSCLSVLFKYKTKQKKKE